MLIQAHKTVNEAERLSTPAREYAEFDHHEESVLSTTPSTDSKNREAMLSRAISPRVAPIDLKKGEWSCIAPKRFHDLPPTSMVTRRSKNLALTSNSIPGPDAENGGSMFSTIHHAVGAESGRDCDLPHSRKVRSSKSQELASPTLNSAKNSPIAAPLPMLNARPKRRNRTDSSSATVAESSGSNEDGYATVPPPKKGKVLRVKPSKDIFTVPLISPTQSDLTQPKTKTILASSSKLAGRITSKAKITSPLPPSKPLPPISKLTATSLIISSSRQIIKEKGDITAKKYGTTFGADNDKIKTGTAGPTGTKFLSVGQAQLLGNEETPKRARRYYPGNKEHKIAARSPPPLLDKDYTLRQLQCEETARQGVVNAATSQGFKNRSSTKRLNVEIRRWQDLDTGSQANSSFMITDQHDTPSPYPIIDPTNDEALQTLRQIISKFSLTLANLQDLSVIYIGERASSHDHTISMTVFERQHQVMGFAPSYLHDDSMDSIDREVHMFQASLLATLIVVMSAILTTRTLIKRILIHTPNSSHRVRGLPLQLLLFDTAQLSAIQSFTTHLEQVRLQIDSTFSGSNSQSPSVQTSQDCGISNFP
jgi:hypothetical protein